MHPLTGRIDKWLNNKYPQNYIIRSPLTGTLIIAIFVFGFAVLYKPLNAHAAGVLSYGATMAVYSFLSGVFVFLFIKILKTFSFFSNSKDWTILKELSVVFIVLILLGIAIYLLGFFIEPSGRRWNISTFLNSLKGGFLTGIIPITFFSAINYHYLFTPVINYNDKDTPAGLEVLPAEDLIHITSQLKKEDLSFYPSEFLYAESDGNYVNFYLNKNNILKKETIRNSINNIEQQLSQVPYFLRTHRAFIVNLKKVRSKQGNTLGYMIKLAGTDIKIPVSRTNTNNYNCLFARYHSS
jgi:hypothetical protein